MKNVRDLYRGIIGFKKGYQPRTNRVKDEKGDLVADSYCIVARWRKYFSQLLNTREFNYVRHTELYTAETLMLKSSAFEVELAIVKLRSH
jgi:hypothetical protein